MPNCIWNKYCDMQEIDVKWLMFKPVDRYQIYRRKAIPLNLPTNYLYPSSLRFNPLVSRFEKEEKETQGGIVWSNVQGRLIEKCLKKRSAGCLMKITTVHTLPAVHVEVWLPGTTQYFHTAGVPSVQASQPVNHRLR